MLWNSGHCGSAHSQRVAAVIIIVAVAGPEPSGLTVTQLYQRSQWIKGQKVMVLLRQGTALIDSSTHLSICRHGPPSSQPLLILEAVVPEKQPLSTMSTF